MFSLNNYPQIISFLKSYSKVYQQQSKEVVVFCPYCDDASRKINPNHGHLYLAVNYPVFHCFRCDTSGPLYQFLSDIEYPQLSEIDDLRGITKIKTNRDYGNKLITNDLRIDLIDSIFKFKKEKPNMFKEFEEYVKSRIGISDFLSFGLFPRLMEKELVIDFYNKINELNCSRFINLSNKRYKKYDTNSGIYFFQDWNFERYKEITFCEGPFDIINLYLYNDVVKNSLFISMLGKKYISAIEKVIETELVFGSFKINVVFDKDVINYNFILNKLNWISNKINPKIEIVGYLPEIEKDTGVYPSLIKV